MKNLKIAELKNNTPLEQLGADLSKQSSHEVTDSKAFTTFVRTNYGQMYVDEIRRIFKQFDSGQFTAEVSDTYSFNEWFARVITGYRSFSMAKQKEIYKTDHDYYPQLFDKMKQASIESKTMQFRPDIAVYGYNLFKKNKELPDVDIESSVEFSRLQGKFLQDRRANGAVLYDMNHPLNLASYKNFVKIYLFEKCFKRVYGLG